MRVSTSFFDLLESFEGFRECPYLDQGGVPTIGIGTTHYPMGIRVKMTDVCIKHDRALIYAKSDVGNTEDLVSTLLPKLTQNQFDTLVSFTYNVGDQALKDSTLLRMAKVDPNNPALRLEFRKWVNVKGRPNDGLIKRRKIESDLYFKQ